MGKVFRRRRGFWLGEGVGLILQEMLRNTLFHRQGNVESCDDPSCLFVSTWALSGFRPLSLLVIFED